MKGKLILEMEINENYCQCENVAKKKTKLEILKSCKWKFEQN